MKPRDYIPLVLMVFVLVVVLGGTLYLTAHQPPPEKRAFRPDWDCKDYDGGEVCHPAKK